jgi:hypothetical protein
MPVQQFPRLAPRAETPCSHSAKRRGTGNQPGNRRRDRRPLVAELRGVIADDLREDRDQWREMAQRFDAARSETRGATAAPTVAGVAPAAEEVRTWRALMCAADK